MARITREALAAGALGFTTSRTILHAREYGLVPGTHSRPEELARDRAARSGDVGHGVFEMVADSLGGEPDLAWIRGVLPRDRRPLTFALAQQPATRPRTAACSRDAEELARVGETMIPQVPCRPDRDALRDAELLPSFHRAPDLPAARGPLRSPSALRDSPIPSVRARVLAEESAIHDPIARALLSNWAQIFPLGDPPDYEPPREASASERRRADRPSSGGSGVRLAARAGTDDSSSSRRS
jgi:N-acyl-D-aspartate/D-glutamate deacylase